tara:strand:+ start:150 stop:389 length:240 start_codon:yes stop_codon:yes gene_type:complete
MKQYNVKYSVEYNCTIFIPEQNDIYYPEEDELLYNNIEAQILDRISAIDIPQGGNNGSAVVKGSFCVLETLLKHTDVNI